MKKEEKKSGGTTYLGVLLIVFVVLKLTDNINWSWWVTLIPLWIGIALGLFKVIVEEATKNDD